MSHLETMLAQAEAVDAARAAAQVAGEGGSGWGLVLVVVAVGIVLCAALAKSAGSR